MKVGDRVTHEHIAGVILQPYPGLTYQGLGAWIVVFEDGRRACALEADLEVLVDAPVWWTRLGLPEIADAM